MKQRLLTSAAILLVTIPLIIFSNYIVYPIVTALLSFIATYEILRVIGFEKRMILALPAYIIATTFPMAAYFLSATSASDVLLIVAATAFVYLVYVMSVSVFSKGQISFAAVSEVFSSVTYVVVSFTSLTLLRYLDSQVGVFVLALVFIVAWVCDAAAYVVGSLFGKHKLIVEISPKKTVEGAIGGVVFAVLAFLLYGFILDALVDGMSVNYIALAVFGLTLSVVSQLGDLIASVIKREHGAKDYGNILPGHGGIMDRFDSILAVSTILMILAYVIPPFKMI